MSGNLRVIVLGYIVRGPIGGLAWHHLQYLIGLRKLGYDVTFVEDSDDYPSCYDPSTNSIGTDASYGLKFVSRVLEKFGLERHWAYYDAHEVRWRGPESTRIQQVCEHADVLLNISGVNPLRPWFMAIPHRILIDTDPTFTQIRHLTNADACNEAAKHTAFFTFAENIGQPSCTVPTDGFKWQPTRQPIVLDLWQVFPGPEHGKFTTVMQWESYKKVFWEQREYGMKSDSFEPYLNLPRYCGQPFEIALGSENAPRKLLVERGWQLQNPLEVAKDPWSYQEYIRRSKAEFSVAKHGYVVTNSGWFSERSAAYLASGRPVVTQDTGFSRCLPAGDGLLSFSGPENAVTAIENVCMDYAHHCAMARAIAENYFDSKNVLRNLIDIGTGA